MTRKCDCSGACGPKNDGVSRRGFLGLLGAGTASTVIAGASLGGEAASKASPEDLAAWKKSLFEPASPRLYRSGSHTDARLHLGGIGTGNLEIGADGQFTTWQLFNTLRDGHIPFHFAVKAGGKACLLQTAGGPGLPLVKEIEMTGEYPVAVLRFIDPELAVKIELEAFSPFSPLDTRLSSMPLAAFVFRIQNPTDRPQQVSLAALIQNPIGYDAAGTIKENSHPNFGGNQNVFSRDGAAATLALKTVPGRAPTIDRPLAVFIPPSLHRLLAPPSDRPKELTFEALERLKAPPAAGEPRTVVWIEEPAGDLSEPALRSALQAVMGGVTLLFSGRSMPLLQTYAQLTGGKPLDKAILRPDILFEDFEKGYEKWSVEGKAFGDRPARGTLANQQKVSGFLGKGLVNTYLEGDGTTGRLTSRPFTIERNFIRFLVGGGSQPTTQIRLLVDGKAVRARSGRDNERLETETWEVRDLQGKSAHFEIVDEATGGWGHINIDQIEFSDQPGSHQLLALLDEMLPARFSGLTRGDSGAPVFQGLSLKPEARESTGPGGMRLIIRPLGKGQVIVAAGSIIDPQEAELAGARQRAYQTLAGICGATYLAPLGAVESACGFGTLALATLGEKPSALPAFQDFQQAFAGFAESGRFPTAETERPAPPTPSGKTVNGALSSTVEVPPGGSKEVPFLLGWHYPNKYNHAGTWMGCHYATVWPDAPAVIKEAAASFARLREKTARFRKTFYDSSLPYWLLDCLTSQAAIIRHVGIVFRIASGDAFGWEGSNGCCQPTCTHVWGYEQSLSRLFPDLERIMRRIDFKHQQRPDGGINNRTDVPSPPHPTGEQPFADGHASCVLKAYREALNSPDESFFKEYWPQVKKAVEYLIGRDAAHAGGSPSGILEDDQWNTYDEALHGVTTFIGTYYLAALRAGEEWAKRAGDAEAAGRFRAVFEKGKKKLSELCWNGEYFHQQLPGYEKMPGEVGPGCMSDQLIGQWWAHQLGLGYLLEKDQVQSALRAVFKNNWKDDLTGWKHMPRAFAGDRDKGLIICTWPKGGRPGHVMLYSDEVWTGIEYQVAAHLVYEGMVEEALAVAKGARDRYDGLPRPPIPRNPWNEIECGGHYARAMSSWSLLLALSGYEYDGPAKSLRFTPRMTPEKFKSFFAGPEGWGSLTQLREGEAQKNAIAVAEGTFAVTRLVLAPKGEVKKAEVTAAGKKIEAALKLEGGEAIITLSSSATLNAGESLEVTLS
jgi:uncharacterized protein (DUF608 family)